MSSQFKTSYISTCARSEIPPIQTLGPKVAALCIEKLTTRAGQLQQKYGNAYSWCAFQVSELCPLRKACQTYRGREAKVQGSDPIGIRTHDCLWWPRGCSLLKMCAAQPKSFTQEMLNGDGEMWHKKEICGFLTCSSAQVACTHEKSRVVLPPKFIYSWRILEKKRGRINVLFRAQVRGFVCDVHWEPRTTEFGQSDSEEITEKVGLGKVVQILLFLYSYYINLSSNDISFDYKPGWNLVLDVCRDWSGKNCQRVLSKCLAPSVHSPNLSKRNV